MPLLGWLATTVSGSLIFNSVRGALFWGLKFFLGWLLMAFGVGLVSFAGLNPIMDGLLNFILGYINFPSNVISYVGMLNVDKVLTVWISAINMRLVMTAATQFRWKNAEFVNTHP